MEDILAEFIGPEFIDKLADKQLHAGLETDAAALRANSAAWSEDRARLDRQAQEIDALQRRLSGIQQLARAA